MKKILCALLTVVLLFMAVLPAFAVNQAYAETTSAHTPITSASVLFTKKFGTNYKSSPTPPAVVGDTLLIVSGVKLYKLNAETGEEISSVKMQGSTLYATVAPLYADGKVFVVLDEGIVQAFDYETMNSLWVYTDNLGGQALCPITYDNGYIYTGFWNDETEYANYVCLSTEDENTNKETEAKSAEWTYKALGGFYWAGCAVTEEYIVFGKDDGKKDSASDSAIISLNKSSGELVSSLTVKGDIRSSVTYSAETDSFYASSKAGYIYKFNMDSSGKLGSLKAYTASGSVTATPVIYGGRLYAGCQKAATGEFVVLDANTMEDIYSCDMHGYPQASMLLSTGHEAETGKVYVYSTYNTKPGGITVFEDSAGQTQAVKTELFTPSDDMSQYCISTVSASENGTLYYKNDSGNIFALKEAQESGINSLLQRIIEKIKAFIIKIFALLQK